MSAYTPGPWAIRMPADGFQTRHPAIDGDTGGVALAEWNGNVERTNANARLIAAAPELLAALQWAIDQVEDDLDLDHQAALKAARAAVARATGGAA